jgi:hypothetical protein
VVGQRVAIVTALAIARPEVLAHAVDTHAVFITRARGLGGSYEDIEEERGEGKQDQIGSTASHRQDSFPPLIFKTPRERESHSVVSSYKGADDAAAQVGPCDGQWRWEHRARWALRQKEARVRGRVCRAACA